MSKKRKALQAEPDAIAVIGTNEWKTYIPAELQQPLANALYAMEANDLAAAHRWFGECMERIPADRLDAAKPILYFGGQVAAQGYFTLKGRDPFNENLPEWRAVAETLTKAAFEVAPTDPIASHNVGRFLQDVGENEEACQFYRRTLMLDGKQVETWGNYGTALYTLGHVDKAWQAWNRCLALPATKPTGKLSQSYIWLRKGEYVKGWQAYGERWKSREFTNQYGRQNDFAVPVWDGGKLPKGHMLLVHGEQGHGDHVQFARFVPVLRERGYNVVALETRKPLVRWMQATFPDIEVVCRNEGVYPGFTHHVSLMDLPMLLGTTLETIPPPVAPTLSTMSRWDHDAVLQKMGHTGVIGGRIYRIGIAWEGAKGNPADDVRSIPPELIGLLAGVPGVEWVNLQFAEHGPITARAWLGATDGTEGCIDVFDSAAVIASLDLVITVDTLTAHLAGSLGVETWVLHRFCREWRWLETGDSSPWYPSITNWTQSNSGDWAEVLRRVRSALEARVMRSAA